MASARIWPLSCPHGEEELLEDQGGCWGGKGVADADVPGNATPAFPVGSPSIPDGFSGVQPSPGAAGGEGSVPTTPLLPRGAIFKSIFSCLIQALLSQQTRRDCEHT